MARLHLSGQHRTSARKGTNRGQLNLGQFLSLSHCCFAKAPGGCEKTVSRTSQARLALCLRKLGCPGVWEFGAGLPVCAFDGGAALAMVAHQHDSLTLNQCQCRRWFDTESSRDVRPCIAVEEFSWCSGRSADFSSSLTSVLVQSRWSIKTGLGIALALRLFNLRGDSFSGSCLDLP